MEKNSSDRQELAGHAMNVLLKKLGSVKIHAQWRWNTLQRHLRRERLRRRIAKADGPLRFNFRSPGNGMFAHLTWCLHVAGWATRHGKSFHVGCSSPNYGNRAGDLDWFAQILEHQKPLGKDGAAVPFLVREFEDLPFFSEASVFSLKDARKLFRENFRIEPALARRVAAFKDQLFQGRFVVGLHFRGTDKHVEAERITYEDALHSARRALAAAEAATGTIPALFLATDEAAMVEFAPRFLDPYPVISVDAVRSRNGEPIHLSSGTDRLHLALEAMTDALLLGECDLLLKTASMLSGWAAVMSRSKPVLMLNQPRPGCMFFPDYLIAAVAFHSGEEARAVAQALERGTEAPAAGTVPVE